jgi:orotate phosphoribosyltransferase-like protein
MGYAQQQIADEYGVSRQLVHWLLKERETMHESLESNER